MAVCHSLPLIGSEAVQPTLRKLKENTGMVLVSENDDLVVPTGAKTMRKLLLGVGALLMVGAAAPASAQSWGGNSGYGRSNGYGYGYADTVQQHVRACRQHKRFHERLAEEHAEEHEDGFYGRDGHADAHDSLDDAHDEYHDERGGIVENCGYWNRQYYQMLDGYSYPRPYGRSGWSFYYRGY